MIYKAGILLAVLIVILIFSLVFIRSEDYVSDRAEKWSWFIYGILAISFLSMIILISVNAGINNGIANESNNYQKHLDEDSNAVNNDTIIFNTY